VAIFQERLADLHRRLGEMQAELDGENPFARAPCFAGPRAPRAARAPAPAPVSAPPGTQLGPGAAPSRRLLSAMRELLDGYEQMLAHTAPAAAPTVTISAGPFPDTGALEQFERALARLPGVQDVALREHEGADRVILDVQLS
jgi:hypothetical protein